MPGVSAARFPSSMFNLINSVFDNTMPISQLPSATISQHQNPIRTQNMPQPLVNGDPRRPPFASLDHLNSKYVTQGYQREVHSDRPSPFETMIASSNARAPQPLPPYRPEVIELMDDSPRCIDPTPRFESTKINQEIDKRKTQEIHKRDDKPELPSRIQREEPPSRIQREELPSRIQREEPRGLATLGDRRMGEGPSSSEWGPRSGGAGRANEKAASRGAEAGPSSGGAGGGERSAFKVLMESQGKKRKGNEEDQTTTKRLSGGGTKSKAAPRTTKNCSSSFGHESFVCDNDTLVRDARHPDVLSDLSSLLSQCRSVQGSIVYLVPAWETSVEGSDLVMISTSCQGLSKEMRALVRKAIKQQRGKVGLSNQERDDEGAEEDEEGRRDLIGVGVMAIKGGVERERVRLAFQRLKGQASAASRAAGEAAARRHSLPTVDRGRDDQEGECKIEDLAGPCYWIPILHQALGALQLLSQCLEDGSLGRGRMQVVSCDAKGGLMEQRVVSCDGGLMVVSCDAKGLLCGLMLSPQIITLPPPPSLCVIDPTVLHWIAHSDPNTSGASLSNPEREPAAFYSPASIISRMGGGLGQKSNFMLLPPADETTGKGKKAPSKPKAADIQSSPHFGMRAPCHRLRQSMVITMLLFESNLSEINMNDKAIITEVQMTGILATMESIGLPFDPTSLISHRTQVFDRMEELRLKAVHLVGGQSDFNLFSSQQLAHVLFQVLRLPIPAASTLGRTHLSTSVATLKQLKHLHPLPAIVLEARKLQNFCSKYLEPGWVRRAIVEARSSGRFSRIRCSWNQVNTATGRLSSNQPNLQAVTKYELNVTSAGADNEDEIDLTEGEFDLTPINIRAAFVSSCPSSVLLAADYSQVELRVMAHLSGDARLIEILRLAHTEAGDVFTLISQAIHGSGDNGSLTASAKREQAKRCVYGIIYGISAHGLFEQLKEQGLTLNQCQRLMDSFFSQFPSVKSFISKIQSDASNNGYITTIGGRRRTLNGIHSNDFQTRSSAFRIATNSTIQGSAADIIKVAMVNFASFASEFNAAEGSTRVTLLAQIHDELLIECAASCVDEVVAKTKELMEKAWRLSVPLQIKVVMGKSWGTQE